MRERGLLGAPRIVGHQGGLAIPAARFGEVASLGRGDRIADPGARRQLGLAALFAEPLDLAVELHGEIDRAELARDSGARRPNSTVVDRSTVRDEPFE